MTEPSSLVCATICSRVLIFSGYWNYAVSAADFQPNGQQPVSSSAVAIPDSKVRMRLHAPIFSMTVVRLWAGRSKVDGIHNSNIPQQSSRAAASAMSAFASAAVVKLLAKLWVQTQHRVDGLVALPGAVVRHTDLAAMHQHTIWAQTGC